MFETFETFVAQATASELFAGGLALGLLGATAGILHTVLRKASAVMRRMLVASVTVDNRSSEFRHLLLFLDAHSTWGRIRHLRATGMSSGGQALYAPAPGQHWLRVGTRWACLSRDISEKTRVGRSSTPMEQMTLQVPFARPALIRGWIAQGAELAERAQRAGPDLHVLKGDWWDHVTSLRARSLASVICEDDRLSRLCTDMRRFYAAEDWYGARGVPWRRGYLLYGPPGTGKSSIIRALASELDRDIATIGLQSPDLSDEALRDGMASAPARAIIVLEDIDAAFAARDAERKGTLTFSGLLNAIDGVAAQEGRALVMTTNHPERLDPALIRPGRADVRVELAEVGAEAAKAMFLRFFPGEAALAQAFAKALGARRLTPARLQGWLLSHADDPASAATAADLLDTPSPLAAE